MSEDRPDTAPDAHGRPTPDGTDGGAGEVARYYDRNTLRFLLVGLGGGSWAIHRLLWGPGVTTIREAAQHVNELLARAVEARAPHAGPTVLDLGCGVGGTVFHLARRFPGARLVGVTVSPRQVALARRLADRLGLAGWCRFVEADFQALALDLEADVALAVESFVHAGRPQRFFAAAAGHLRRGGHLLLVDDFLAQDEARLGDGARRRVRDFREGWRVPGLTTVEACARTAAEAGLALVGDDDLTPLIRLGRPRDRVIAGLAPLFRRMGLVRVPFFANMIGGDALQTGLRDGWLRYRFLTFRREDPASVGTVPDTVPGARGEGGPS